MPAEFELFTPWLVTRARRWAIIAIAIVIAGAALASIRSISSWSDLWQFMLLVLFFALIIVMALALDARMSRSFAVIDAEGIKLVYLKYGFSYNWADVEDVIVVPPPKGGSRVWRLLVGPDNVPTVEVRTRSGIVWNPLTNRFGTAGLGIPTRERASRLPIRDAYGFAESARMYLGEEITN